jgi:hypothetical protein
MDLEASLPSLPEILIIPSVKLLPIQLEGKEKIK